MFSFKPRIYFDAPVDPAPNPVADDDQEFDHLNDDPLEFGMEDIDDMTNDSPIVSQPKAEPEPTPKEEPKAEEPKEEPKDTEPEPKPDEPTEPITYKVGEKEYSEEEITGIIAKFDGMEEWEENLRNLSHLQKMDNATAKALAGFVSSKQEIPKGLVDKPIITSVHEALNDFKLEIPYEDLDGKPQTMEVTMDQLKPLVDKAIELTTMAHKPELDKSDALTTKVRRDRMNEMITNFVDTEGMDKVFAFHKGSGVDLIDHVDNVLMTPGHPDLPSVKRLQALVDQIDHKEIKTLADAHTFLYGDTAGTAQTIQGIIKNQKKGAGLSRSKEPNKVDPDEMDIDKNDAESTLKSIGA